MADDPLRDADETADERLVREDQAALAEALVRVMEERGLDEADLVSLLIGEIYHYRTVAYVAETGRPSESGLRLSLDRMRKQIEELHRGYRRNAGAILRDVLAAFEAMEKEEGDAEAGDGLDSAGDPGTDRSES